MCRRIFNRQNGIITISLHIREVWFEFSSQCAHEKIFSPYLSKDTQWIFDQTMIAVRMCNTVGFVVAWLVCIIWSYHTMSRTTSCSLINFNETGVSQLITSITVDRVKRIWYLSPMRAAKVQASLRIRAVSPEPSLLAHTSSESRETFRQKARSLVPLNG